jgi:2-keto-3-deoxy-6-phosphogluconate aldolase
MATLDVLAELEALAVVPVVEIDDAAAAVPLASTLAEAGLPVVEVTFRTPAARDAVAAIAAELPDFLLGAGTLVLPDMVAAAAEAGARFGVSPGCRARASLSPTSTTCRSCLVRSPRARSAGAWRRAARPSSSSRRGSTAGWPP